MTDLDWFEEITRRTLLRNEPTPEDSVELHPFETRNIHPDLPVKVKRLYDDGYYPESTFEAFKFVEKEVKRISALRGLTGNKLMMAAFNEQSPVIHLNGMASDSDKDEQFGYRYIFAGAQSGIRNPRGHETELTDSPDLCLDHLSLASILLRKLDEAGIR
ncbi:TIGR02391 family protein [Salinibacterium sp.]|uniref:TIGR02391 family protein n=1 Tax=Salinibacterium sp. TaxID=1915057 RepID=UPI00286B30F4|nr:TIGR02391 family protein [Salinibacterium sp.]